MVKLVPHYIISKSFANHPVIELLSKHGLFDFEESSNIAQIACDLHYVIHVIPKHFSDDPVIELLGKHGLFDIDAERNTVYLPVDPMVARQLGISPYSSQPLDSYMKGIGDTLKRFRDSPDFALAQGADKAALKRLEEAVNSFQAKVVDGLATGQVFVATPLG
jgi:hypothetical protein